MGRRAAISAAWALLLALALIPWVARAESQAQRVVPSAMTVKLTRGDVKQLTAQVLPQTALQAVVWRSNKSSVASVTPEGLVTGRKVGSALLTVASVQNPAITATVRVKVVKGATPTKVVLGDGRDMLAVGESLTLSPTVKPANASQMVTYFTSDQEVALVSEAGVLTGQAPGKVSITVRSQVKPAIRATRTFTVYDPLVPYALTIAEDSGYLTLGQRRTLAYTLEPSTALGGVAWHSSAPSVVSVSPEGEICALASGRAQITCRARNGDVEDQLTVVVISGQRTTQVPLRTTAKTASAVSANLAAIDAVLESAEDQLNALAATGQMSSTELAKRKAILNGAFAMYRFPWYTASRVPYWTSDYKGKKDFMPDRVYYGMPYIQHGSGNNRVNRRFTAQKAVNQGYYEKAEGQLYRMTKKRMSSMYVGNDCSAFVCMATFPANGISVNSSVCFQITRDMLSSSTFKKLSGYEQLRPGDLLVKNGHTVMFLYYTNAQHTRMMIIEQGGGNLTTDIHNTVTCSVVNRSSYEGKYKPLRASFLAKLG